MTDKRKKRARALSAKTGMTHAAAMNVLNREGAGHDLCTRGGRLAAMVDLIGEILPVFKDPSAYPAKYVQACCEDLGSIAEGLTIELTPPEPGLTYNPNIPSCCRGCGKPLLLENLYVDDGCPCNTPRGVNFKPQPCSVCGTNDCVRPGHRLPELFLGAPIDPRRHLVLPVALTVNARGELAQIEDEHFQRLMEQPGLNLEGGVDLAVGESFTSIALRGETLEGNPEVVFDRLHAGVRESVRSAIPQAPCCERDHDGDGNCDRHPAQRRRT